MSSLGGAIVEASITDTPRRPHGRREYEIIEDRHEEDDRENSEEAMLREVVKSNVNRDVR